MQAYSRQLTARARGLRDRGTDAERRLWRHLRHKRVDSVRFYRQRPILDYIVDLYCPSANLVVELDDGQHFEMPKARYDCRRTRRLECEGLKVPRFDNRQILNETEAVLEAIRKVVIERL